MFLSPSVYFQGKKYEVNQENVVYLPGLLVFYFVTLGLAVINRLKAYPSRLNTDSFATILILPLLNMQTSLIYYTQDFRV